MEQIAVSFTTQWQPATWLTPTVSIWRRDWKQIVANDTCKEIAWGWYIYNFRQYNNDNVYLYQFDGGDSLSDYDRYKFGGNELDAYTNKYSWWKTAAPYFTTLNKRFDSVDKAFKKQKEYDDTTMRKEIGGEISSLKSDVENKQSYIHTKLLELNDKIDAMSMSAKNENHAQNYSQLNEKLDMMAEYAVRMKEDVDNELSTLDESVAQRISESTDSMNEWLNSRVTIDQLLQQVERLEDKLEEVIQSNLKGQMPNELLDKYDVSLNRKRMSDEEALSAMWFQEPMQPMQPIESMEQPEPTSWMQGRPNLNWIL